jgi:hypothetical protein
MSRNRGRNTGMHWTMMVPTISDEYQMFEWALRQKYHSSFTFPSSFQLVRTADTMATIIPCRLISCLFTASPQGVSWTYQTHGNTKTNLLRLAHVQVPGQNPGKCGEYEIHYYVVDYQRRQRPERIRVLGVSPLPPSLKSFRNFASKQKSSRYQTS